MCASIYGNGLVIRGMCLFLEVAMFVYIAVPN